jgi:hypothetical protein
MNKIVKRTAIVAASLAVVGGVLASPAGASVRTVISYPLARNSVSSGQIVDNSIISNDLHPALRAAIAKAGQAGTPGKSYGCDGNVVDAAHPAAKCPGTDGKPGDPGAPGVSGLHADAPYGKNLPGQDSSDTAIPAGKTAVIWTACAPGESALGGGYRIGDLANESFATGDTVAYPSLQVIASEAAFYKDGKLVNGAEAAPVNANLSFAPNAWAVTVHNADDKASVARAWVTCAKVAK